VSYPVLGRKQAEYLYLLLGKDELDQSHVDELEEFKDDAEFERPLENDLYSAISEQVHLYEKREIGYGGRFDSELSIVVHETLKLDPIIAGDAGFWRWLSFSEDLHEFVTLRYSQINANRLEPARKYYYGLGSIHESMYAYLWLRANCVFDDNRQDPYEVARMGKNVDLWLSHIIRVDYGSVPEMARAFIRFCTIEPGLDTPSSRMLSKEVLRRYTTTIFELMEEKECMEFLDNLWKRRGEWKPY
jgi:hypothetical protein